MGLIIGPARAIVVVMEARLITRTILHAAETSVKGLSRTALILVSCRIAVGLSVLVASTSGPAVLSMPILAPVADFAGATRELVVTAFATASGMVTPMPVASAVVMAALALAADAGGAP